jgi:hypothetical protein
MKAGERAWVYVTDPAYGYGDKGSFSFPSVPPNSKLVYEIDMIASEPPEEVSDDTRAAPGDSIAAVAAATC